MAAKLEDVFPVASRRTFRQRSRIRVAVAILTAGFAFGAAAEPQASASASASAARQWQEPRFRGYTGEGWDEDYGVRRGRCRIDEVVEAAGSRLPVVAGGLAVGPAGARLEPAIDAADRACLGLALELLARGRAVQWQNPRTSITFSVRPLQDLDANCREVEFTVSQRGRRSKSPVRACRDADARWTTLEN